MLPYGWFQSDDFYRMAADLPNPDQRKVRLVCCALIRRLGPLLADARIRAALEAAEDYALFRVNREFLKAKRAALADIAGEEWERVLYDKNECERASCDPWVSRWADEDTESDLYEEFLQRRATAAPPNRIVRLLEPFLQSVACPGYHLGATARTVCEMLRATDRFDDATATFFAGCDLLRDVFGDLTHRITFDPAWRTDTATALVRAMYDSREFGAMPILADALQDAGCEDEVILAHCREPGLHVRGCWVCDKVLGLS